MKKETKTVTKKPAFIVNLTTAETVNDIKLEFIKAKCMQGVKITKDEFLFILSYGAQIALDCMDEYIEELVRRSKTVVIEDDKLTKELLEIVTKGVPKKKPWYKRFWNWITCKK